MAASIGKVFEKEMVIVMRMLFEQRLFSYHRLTDTGAAGSIVADQPSDYIIGLPPGSGNLLDGQRLAFLEVKASEEHHKLGKAMVRSSQRRAIACYRYLLNIPYYILFWDAQDGVMQLWDGQAVMTDRLDKSLMLASWSGVGVINKLQRQRVVDYLAGYFQIPPKADTLIKTR